jgi:hypothetical protein
MTDDKTQTGDPDRRQISLSENYELRDWSKKFGVTEDQLRRAVEKVGNEASEVEKELRSR